MSDGMDAATGAQSGLADFFSLVPERVLDAVEELGERTTGSCYALNSLENRVYDVELEGDARRRVVAKFYRPGRWSRETILDEHRLLTALAADEIPAVAPLAFPDGSTLHRTREGIHFAVFPRVGGRAPDDMTDEQFRELGRLLARVHGVAAALKLEQRPRLDPHVYGTQALETILRVAPMPAGLRARYEHTVTRLVTLGESSWQGVRVQPIHADFHRGNLLRRPDGFLMLDFDDLAVGPPVQDLWLVLPGRAADCPRELGALLEGYEHFRAFDRSSLRLIELLRALRYVRYAGWIAARWQDPSFPRAFPQFGSDHYWAQQLQDLDEQLGFVEGAALDV